METLIYFSCKKCNSYLSQINKNFQYLLNNCKNVFDKLENIVFKLLKKFYLRLFILLLNEMKSKNKKLFIKNIIFVYIQNTIHVSESFSILRFLTFITDFRI